MRPSRVLALSTCFATLYACAVEKAAAGPAPSAETTQELSARAPSTETPQAVRSAQPAAPAEPHVERSAEPAPAPSEATRAKASDRSWATVRTPAAGKARAIGEYSAGCVLGAEALPREGAGFYVRRPERLRHFGHPLLIEFVRGLGGALDAQKLGGIVIGDLGQPRGGPAPDGHASHQSGLDVDIWYPNAQTAKGIPKAAAARRALRAQAVANFPRRAVTEHWSPRVADVLRLTAEDTRVSRIFVNPMVKRALCDSERDRSWLRKVRPWWGHDAHFHVRLACPPDSPGCVPQAELPAGDGCDDVEWWFRPQAAEEREEERAKYRARIAPGDPLPAECHQVLAAPEAESLRHSKM